MGCPHRPAHHPAAPAQRRRVPRGGPPGRGARRRGGRGIVTASGEGTARVWDLATDSRPAADLRRLAQWLAGYQIGAGGGPVALGPAAARREGEALRAKYPADFAVSPAQVLVWHER